MDLTVDLAPHHKTELRLRNPLMTASGTVATGLELAALHDVEALGALVSPGVTLRPRRGNAPPRMVETSAGLLHAAGLPNAGVSALIRNVAPVWARWSVPVIVNIVGEHPEEYARLAARLEGVPGVAALEVNLASLDLASGGAEVGQAPRLAAAIVREIAAITSLPQVVKLTPGVPDIRPIAEAVQQAGAQAIAVGGPVPAMAIDARRRRPALANVVGGLSGPAVKPIALLNVFRAAAVLDIPLVASGGVSSGLDVAEFIMAGATAVQVGTATFRDPAAPWRILAEFEAWCTTEGVLSVEEIRGAAHRRD